MDENEIYEVLGVTPPAGPPAETPQESGDVIPPDGGTTVPALAGGERPDGGTQKGNVSELDTNAGQPAAAGGTLQGNVPEDGAESKDGTPGERPAAGQTAEEQDRTAEQEARWRALAQQEVRRAVETEQARNQAEWSEFFASAGLTDNLNGGKPITSLEEFRAWKAAYDRAKLEQSLKEGKLTPEALAYTIREAMNQQPQKQSPPPAGGTGPAAAPPEVTREQIDAELAEIHRLDGGVNGLEDILKLETGGAFQEAVRRGHSFLDAFKLANFDRLQERRQAEAARQAAQKAAQAARNSARSKEHLLPSGGKAGEGSVAVPGDVMEVYRVMMPGASEAEIIAHYNRTLREMK